MTIRSMKRRETYDQPVENATVLDPTADSLSHANVFDAAASLAISCHCPANRTGPCRDGIITAVIHREKPQTITSTGGRPTCPNPSDTSTGGTTDRYASSPGR